MHILIADPHRLFRAGFELLLSQFFPDAIFASAGDADEAWRLQDSDPSLDLIFLDLAMPGMDRTEGVGRFVRRRPNVPVIIVSANAETQEIAHCIRLGARGYIPKHASAQVLHRAVALVMHGEVFLPEEVLNRFLPQGRDAGIDNPLWNRNTRESRCRGSASGPNGLQPPQAGTRQKMKIESDRAS